MLWGDEKAKAFLADMKRNNVKIATSNGESADFVAAGQFAFFKNRDGVAAAGQFSRAGKPRRTGSDDGRQYPGRNAQSARMD